MFKQVVNSGQRFDSQFGILRRLLRDSEPGLLLDVGAAIGAVTGLMLKESPSSRLVAFEPFTGNLTHLSREWGADPRVTIRAVAVGAHPGEVRFVVPRLVDAKVGVWSRYPGASTVGHFARRSAKGHAVTVPVVRLDDEITEHVRFLKIDVQGAELGVLLGARGLIESRGIDLIYVEFAGDLRVLRLLHRAGYKIFDGVYLGWPTRRYIRNWFRGRRKLVAPPWVTAPAGRLSTGETSFHFRPPVPFRSFALYCAWFYFTRLFLIGLQTDLLCVHRDYLEKFEAIVKAT